MPVKTEERGAGYVGQSHLYRALKGAETNMGRGGCTYRLGRSLQTAPLYLSRAHQYKRDFEPAPRAPAVPLPLHQTKQRAFPCNRIDFRRSHQTDRSTNAICESPRVWSAVELIRSPHHTHRHTPTHTYVAGTCVGLFATTGYCSILVDSRDG